jgi:tol-pal system protein YbgF
MQIRCLHVFVMCALFAGCVPQAEVVKLQNDMNQVRAEVKNVKTQVPDLSGIKRRQDQLEESIKGTTDLEQRLADQGARYDQLSTDLQILQGKLEENNFRIKELAQKVDDRSYTLAELSARLTKLESRLSTTVTGTSPAPEAKAQPRMPSPSEAYQQAKTDYDKGNYDLSIAGFENYLKQFPDASQADSALYWIGECWYSKKEFAKAIDAFAKVLKDHPQSDKAPGARLKIGYSYLNEKNTAKARENLRRVIKDYPRSKEAELAKERLKKTGK